MAHPQRRQELNMYATNAQILAQVPFGEPVSDQHLHSHPHLSNGGPVGLAQYSIPAVYYGVSGCESQRNYGLEREKRLKEHDFLENMSHRKAAVFVQPQFVTTGLSLPLENTCKDSVADIGFKLERQDAEIDRILKLEGNRLRKAILKKLQNARIQTILYLEERILQKLHQKEVELESITKRTINLEKNIEIFSTKAHDYQQRAVNDGRLITPLVVYLRQIYAQRRASQEGSDESEVVDSVYCPNSQAEKDGNQMKEKMSCKACMANKVSILILPCKHLCLCKDCENNITICPICQSLKLHVIEVYI